jgi:hypothetical protein
MTKQYVGCRTGKMLAAVLSVFPAVCAQPDVRTFFAVNVGIYHWAGRQADGVASGVRAVLALNGSVVRIALSPRMDIDYNRSSQCLPFFRLANVLDDDDLRSALADPRLKVVMATVYDGVSFADCWNPSYLNLGFYSEANTTRLVAEYSDFVYRLHVLFAGTGKRFILANWEGDNAIYCGSAYSYAFLDEFRANCDRLYPQYYGGNENPRESIEAMILWHRARFLGAKSGIERARAEGLSGIDVLMAPEISAVRMLHDRGFATVLYDVLPRISFDYVSYSSWESLGAAKPADTLASDLDLIRSVTASSSIIVGEMGFSRSAYGDRQLAAVQAYNNAAIRWGAAYIICWSLYDSDPRNDFGLFDVNGALTPIGAYYRSMFTVPAVPPPAEIR